MRIEKACTYWLLQRDEIKFHLLVGYTIVERIRRRAIRFLRIKLKSGQFRKRKRNRQKLTFYACRWSRQQMKLIPWRSYRWQTSGRGATRRKSRSRCHWVIGKFSRPAVANYSPRIPFTIENFIVIKWIVSDTRLNSAFSDRKLRDLCVQRGPNGDRKVQQKMQEIRKEERKKYK